jgi:hypothetical protein
VVPPKTFDDDAELSPAHSDREKFAVDLLVTQCDADRNNFVVVTSAQPKSEHLKAAMKDNVPVIRMGTKNRIAKLTLDMSGLTIAIDGTKAQLIVKNGLVTHQPVGEDLGDAKPYTYTHKTFGMSCELEFELHGRRDLRLRARAPLHPSIPVLTTLCHVSLACHVATCRAVCSRRGTTATIRLSGQGVTGTTEKRRRRRTQFCHCRGRANLSVCCPVLCCQLSKTPQSLRAQAVSRQCELFSPHHLIWFASPARSQMSAAAAMSSAASDAAVAKAVADAVVASAVSHAFHDLCVDMPSVLEVLISQYAVTRLCTKRLAAGPHWAAREAACSDGALFVSAIMPDSLTARALDERLSVIGPTGPMGQGPNLLLESSYSVRAMVVHSGLLLYAEAVTGQNAVPGGNIRALDVRSADCKEPRACRDVQLVARDQSQPLFLCDGSRGSCACACR